MAKKSENPIEETPDVKTEATEVEAIQPEVVEEKKSGIDSQDKAEKEAKKYKVPPHVAVVYVTEDANVFYDYDHSAAHAHANQNKLQIFTVRKK